MTCAGRLKRDIKPLTHTLDSILQLQGKTYRWKEDATLVNYCGLRENPAAAGFYFGRTDRDVKGVTSNGENRFIGLQSVTVKYYRRGVWAPVSHFVE